VINVRTGTVGKIQALVGSEFARGAFATESQKMINHLSRVENGLNAFLESLEMYNATFDERYPGQENGDVGAQAPEGEAEPPPPPPTEAPAEAPPPPVPAAQ
jgi:hypothetical protein